MQCQKELFSLDPKTIYLNGAYMSPNLNAVVEAGMRGIHKKTNPANLVINDFFDPPVRAKKLFAQIIGAEDYASIALIPSVSYGIANVAHNVALKENEEVIIVGEQFPSNYYCWKHHADKVGAKIKTISCPVSDHRGASWNEEILSAITERTKVVTMPIVHWADGTVFDIKRICQYAHEHDALFILDGTQSIGAMPFSIKEVPADAVICAAYKWLLSPYSTGFCYMSDYFSDGEPIEHSWINRKGSEDFSGLVNYQDDFKRASYRYDVGQAPNFALMPMCEAALQQIIEWTPEAITAYVTEISHEGLGYLKERFLIEEDRYRAKHLFGIRLKSSSSQAKIKDALQEANISVSYRGDCIRVSPNVYNTKNEFFKLVNILMENA